MATSPHVVAHALDLLQPLGPVDARRMFGGHGLYLRGVMFALIDDDEVFLKTDEETRPRFEQAGCRQWTYSGMTDTSYFRPPDDAHEDPEAMFPWARLALEAALRRHAEKVARARATAERRAAREAKAAEKTARPGAKGAPRASAVKTAGGGARRRKSR